MYLHPASCAWSAASSNIAGTSLRVDDNSAGFRSVPCWAPGAERLLFPDPVLVPVRLLHRELNAVVAEHEHRRQLVRFRAQHLLILLPPDRRAPDSVAAVDLGNIEDCAILSR